MRKIGSWTQSRMAKTMLILRGVPWTDGYRTGPALWQSTQKTE